MSATCVLCQRGTCTYHRPAPQPGETVDLESAEQMLTRDVGGRTHWYGCHLAHNDCLGLLLIARVRVLEAALREIEQASWDSGSIPAPEVVSRIYGMARAALDGRKEKGNG